MAREIRLDDENATLYNRIRTYRRILEGMMRSGYVNIGRNTHSGKKGPRGRDLYNDISSIMKKILGYAPKSGEKLSEEQLEKLEKTYKEAENYFRRRVKHI
ncbi:MAG: hypothetical protein J7J15_01440 [Candidatus Aenigmarchaeota archaeon]|nr:hypothetical protein [Candidatus Aenigmarchaeota archaeon]